MGYYGKVNEAGLAAFTEWLRDVLVLPEFAEEWARRTVQGLDGSDAENCGMRAEVGRFSTVSGNPETYYFGRDEFDLLPVDDECSENCG